MGQRGRPVLRGLHAGAQLQPGHGAPEPGGPAQVQLVQAGQAAGRLAVIATAARQALDRDPERLLVSPHRRAAARRFGRLHLRRGQLVQPGGPDEHSGDSEQ